MLCCNNLLGISEILVVTHCQDYLYRTAETGPFRSEDLVHLLGFRWHLQPLLQVSIYVR